MIQEALDTLGFPPSSLRIEVSPEDATLVTTMTLTMPTNIEIDSESGRTPIHPFVTLRPSAPAFEECLSL